jgi:modulator of FtsH protease HflK
MERVLGGADKLVYDGGPSGQGVVPFLPLNELTAKRAPTTGQPSSGGTR